MLAFLIGGLVVLVTTGKNPLTTYKAIFEGAGLNWFLEVGSTSCGSRSRSARAVPLERQRHRVDRRVQPPADADLLVPLILTGLAVAFAFRCGMFNIGGQGQYLVGSIVAVWVGSELPRAARPPARPARRRRRRRSRARVWAGIAGFLKATRGAHEVISTIMLNWIAIWVGAFLFGLGGPLQNDTQPFVPISNDVVEKAKLPVFWGDPVLQALHIGFFVALAALVVYWIMLNRTTLGYEVRAVGFNPEAARYGGITVARTTSSRWRSRALFAGLAGAIDMLGWQFRIDTNDMLISSQIGFIGIAVALLGRNTAVGVGLSAHAVRRARHRHVDPQPRPRDLPARAGRQPDDDHPGARRALRRRRRADPLRLGSGRRRRARQTPRRRL